MRYLGGKSRLAKKFAPILQKSLDKTNFFVEPFVGGFNIVPALKTEKSKIFCSDIHTGLINLYRNLQRDFVIPDFISEEEYSFAKNNLTESTDPLIVFISFACSYGGKEWGGYARGENRNWTLESKKALEKKRKFMQKVEFKNISFFDLFLNEPATIYCDPPYKNTTEYKNGAFDSEKFYRWCEQKKKEGHDVFVSEFNAPSSFKEVWRHERKETVAKDNKRVVVDKLFCL